MNPRACGGRVGLGAAVALGLTLSAAGRAWAQTLCAEVKLEILQEATLEREAFDAKLIINNNLPDQPLTSLKVMVFVKDEEGNPADGAFFVKLNSLSGTNAVDGTGVVQSSSSAEIRWLIIPSTGAGGTGVLGKRYAVKAAISGMSAGVPQSVITFDDFITVKPQPSLKLEYVLPYEVFADEPLTAQIEPIEPFPLGVRVTNVGYGAARDFRIDSAQPVIVENKLGLLVDFKLLGTVVGGKTIPETLLVPFGDIPSGGVGQASWVMSTTLSGRFIEFTSTFTHAAELGGSLTSLIQSVTTYTLLKDVLVDLPGRDATPDFLVNASYDRQGMQALLDSGGVPPAEFILESDQPAPISVAEVPAELSGTLGGSNASLTLTLNGVGPNVWAHASVPFSYGSGATLVSAKRSDGKTLGNVWISKHFRKSDTAVLYRLNILDLTSQATSYTINFSPVGLDLAPGAVADLAAVTGSKGGELFVSWAAPGEDGSTGNILGGRYMIERETDPNAAFSPQSSQVIFATSTAPGRLEGYLASGAIGNTTNYLRLWTQDTGGAISAMSNAATAYVLPYPPNTPAFANVSSGSLTVSWQVGNNSLPIEYQVSVDTDSSLPYVASSPFLDSFHSTHTFSGLAPNTSYYFYGLGRNPDTLASSQMELLGWAATLSVVPEPGAYAEVSTASFTAVWGPGANPAGTEYLVELSSHAERVPVLAQSGWIAATSYAFVGLASETTYYGRVKARNRQGVETAYADLGSVTTLSAMYYADILAPRTSLAVGLPKFGTEPLFVTDKTTISLSAVDDMASVGDGQGLGVAESLLSLDGGAFSVVSGTFSLVEPGTHTLRFYSVDFKGHQESVLTRALAVDPLAPQTSMVASTAAFVAVSSASYYPVWTEFGLSALDPPSTPTASGVALTEYRVDPGTTTPFETFVATFSLAEGTHLVEFRSIDNLGNLELTVSATAFIDATAPQTTMTFVGGVRFSSGTLLYGSGETGAALQAEDPVIAGAGSGVLETRISLDGGPFERYVSTVSGAPEGSHRVEYYSLDNVLNREATRYFEVLIDSTPPVSSILPDPAGFITSRATITISGTDPASGGIASGFKVASYGVDGSTPTLYADGFALSEGSHTVAYFSEDQVANREAERLAVYHVDDTPPSTTLRTVGGQLAVLAGRIFVSADTRFALDGQDSVSNGVASGVLETLFNVDSASFTVYTATFDIVGEGEHAIRYRSRDRAGNLEDLHYSTGTVDATGPAIAISSPANDGHFVAGLSTITVLFGVSDNNDPAPAFSAWLVQVQDLGSPRGEQSARIQVSTGQTLAPAELDDGIWELQVSATDFVLNRSSAVASFEVIHATDTMPPRTSMALGLPNVAGDPPLVSSRTLLGFSIADDLSSLGDGRGAGARETRYGLDGADFGVFAASFTLVAEGTHTVRYFSLDLAGNTEEVRISTVAADNTPPVTHLAAGPFLYRDSQDTGFVSSQTTVGFSAEDPVSGGVASGLGVVLFRDNAGSFQAYSSTFSLAEGLHVLEYQAKDKVDNLEVLASTRLAVDLSAPHTGVVLEGGVQYSTGTTRYISGDSGVALTAADPVVSGAASGVLETWFSPDGAPFMVYASTLTNPPEGAHVLAFYSLDRLLNREATQYYAVSIDSTPPATQLVLEGPATSYEGSEYVTSRTTITLSAGDVLSNGVASGLEKIVYRLDNGSTAAYDAGFELEGGSHSLAYFAVDHVANTEPEHLVQLKVDNTAPITGLALSGGKQASSTEPASFYASADMRFAFVAEDPTASGVAAGLALTEYQDGGGQFVRYTSSFMLAEGRHDLGYRSYDRVGNTEVLRSSTALVDATPPETHFAVLGASAVVDGIVTFQAGSSATLVAQDPVVQGVASGMDRTMYLIDVSPQACEGVNNDPGYPAGTCQNPFFAGPFSLAVGTHTVYFLSQDRVLNEEPVKASSVTVAAPAGSLEGDIVYGGARVGNFVVRAATTTANLIDFSVRTPPRVSTVVVSGPHYRLDGLAPGEYYLSVFRDSNGNGTLDPLTEPRSFSVAADGRYMLNLGTVAVALGSVAVLDAQLFDQGRLSGTVTNESAQTGTVWLVRTDTVTGLRSQGASGIGQSPGGPYNYAVFFPTAANVAMTAYVDANANMLRDPGEDFGQAQAGALGAGSQVSGVNLTISTPTQPPIVGTFSGSFSDPGGVVFDGPGRDIGTGVAVDADGNVYALGASSQGVAGMDWVLFKFNPAGSILAEARVHQGQIDAPFDIAMASESLFVAGTDSLIRTAKYGLDLSPQAVSGSGGNAAAVDGAGNVYTLGQHWEGGIAIEKLSPNLAVMTNAHYPLGSTVGPYGGRPGAIAYSPFNGHVYTVATTTSGPDSAALILEHTGDLAFVRSSEYRPGPGIAAVGNGIAVHSVTGDVYVTATSTSDAGTQTVVLRLDSNLAQLGFTTLANGGADVDIALGEVYLAGPMGMYRLDPGSLATVSCIGDFHGAGFVAAKDSAHVYASVQGELIRVVRRDLSLPGCQSQGTGSIEGDIAYAGQRAGNFVVRASTDTGFLYDFSRSSPPEVFVTTVSGHHYRIAGLTQGRYHVMAFRDANGDGAYSQLAEPSAVVVESGTYKTEAGTVMVNPDQATDLNAQLVDFGQIAGAVANNSTQTGPVRIISSETLTGRSVHFNAAGIGQSPGGPYSYAVAVPTATGVQIIAYVDGNDNYALDPGEDNGLSSALVAVEAGQGVSGVDMTISPGIGPGSIMKGLAVNADSAGNLWEVSSGRMSPESAQETIVAKFSPTGVFVSSVSLPYAVLDPGKWSIRFGPTGEVYALGPAAGPMTTGVDIGIYRLSQAGDALLSLKTIDSALAGTDIVLESNGGLWLTGAVQTSGPPDAPPGEAAYELALWKYDPASDTVALKSRFSSGYGFDAGLGVAADPSGNLWVAGYYMDPNTPGDAKFGLALWKFNDSGTRVLAGPFRKPGFLTGPDFGFEADVVYLSSAIFVSASRVNSRGNTDLALLKYDLTGNPVFEQAWHSSDGWHEAASRMAVNPGSGRVVIAGGGKRQENGQWTGSRPMVWEYESNGSLVSARTADSAGFASDMAISGSDSWLAVESGYAPYLFTSTNTVAGAASLEGGSPDTTAPVTSLVALGTFTVQGGIITAQEGTQFALIAQDPEVDGIFAGVRVTHFLLDHNLGDCQQIGEDPTKPAGTCENTLYAGPFPLGVGSHFVYYASEDYAGNNEQAKLSSAVVVAAAPSLITPSSGPIGVPFTISSAGFGPYNGANTQVRFGVVSAPLSLWNNTTITGTVPGLSTGTYAVSVVRQHPSSSTVWDAGTFMVSALQVASLSPSSAPIGAPFALTGTSFGPYDGANTRVLIGGATAPLSLWNDGTIQGTVPGALAPGAYSVRVERQAGSMVSVSNLKEFAVTVPQVAGFSPLSGPIGMPFSITGTSFGPYNGANTRILIGGTTAPLSLWTDTAISGTIPGIGTGVKAVWVERLASGGVASSNTTYFEVTAPSLASISPSSGPIGAAFTLTGASFGPYNGANTQVLFGTSTASLSLWTDTQIKGTVPGTLGPGPYPVVVRRKASDGSVVESQARSFQVVGLYLAGISPSSGPIGAPFTITGTDFDSYAGANSRVLFNGTTAALSLWSDTQIKGTVPPLATGPYDVHVERQSGTGIARSNTAVFTVSGVLAQGISPTAGPIGVPFSITGQGFGPYNGANTRVLIGGATAPLSLWSDTVITGTIPGLSAGTKEVFVERASDGGISRSDTFYFDVTVPQVVGVAPSSGPIGMPITITGANFGPYNGALTKVLIDGTSVPLSLWSDGTISGSIPGVAPGLQTLMVERLTSDGGLVQSSVFNFSVLSPEALALSLSSGPIGVPFTITGRNFGPYNGTYTRVLFGGTPASLSLWNDGTISGTIPGIDAGIVPVIVERRTPDGGLATTQAGTFEVTTPAIASLSPESGPIGMPFTISGTSFGPYNGANTRVLIGGATAPLSLWNDQTIQGSVPGFLAVGQYTLLIERQSGEAIVQSNSSSFSVVVPEVASLTPSSGPIGMPFTITGTGFGPYNGANTKVLIGGTTSPLSLWNDTAIKGTVPGSLAAGNYPVVVVRAAAGGLVSAEAGSFQVTMPHVDSVTPSSAPVGSAFTIKGASFGSYNGANTRVLIGGVAAPLSLWNDATISGRLPYLSSGTKRVLVERWAGGTVIESNADSIEVVLPVISTITPAVALQGTPFELTGTGFGSYAGSATRVLIGATTTAMSLWTDSTIRGLVPDSLPDATYPVVVERDALGGTVRSEPVYFIVDPPGSKIVLAEPEWFSEAALVVSTDTGGKVEAPSRASVEVPPAALEEEITITVSKPKDPDEESKRSVAAKGLAIGKAGEPVEFGPEGTKFNYLVVIELPFDPGLIPAGKTEKDLALHYWNKDHGKWEPLETEVDLAKGTVKTLTDHFSLYQPMVMGLLPEATAPSDFELRDVYAFPNPARGVNPTFRVQAGSAESVEITIFDIAGMPVDKGACGSRQVRDLDNGLGNQMTFECVWDAHRVGSGVYTYMVRARKAGFKDITAVKKVALVK